MRRLIAGLCLPLLLAMPAHAQEAAAALERGDNAGAIAAAAREIATLQATLKANDVRLLDLYNIEGDAYATLGRRDEARAAYRTVEERTRFAVAGGDPAQRIPSRAALIHALSGLADLAAQDGKLDQTEALARKAKKIADAVLPENDPLRRLMASRLANVLASAGKADEAQAVLGTATAGDRLEDALALKTAAQIAISQKDFAAAEARLRQAVQLVDRLAGNSSDLALAYRSDLGAALIGAEKYGDAESVLRAALANAGDAARDRPDFASARASLAYALAAEERWEECYAEALAAEATFNDWLTTLRGAAPSGYDGQFVHDLVAVAAWHVMQAHPERKDEMMAAAFAALQRNQAPRAATALMQMAARQAAHDPELAAAVRLLQDSEAAFAQSDAKVMAGLGGSGLSTKLLYSGAGGSKHDELVAARRLIDQRFGAYHALTGLAPLALDAVPPLLGDDDLLVVPYLSRSQVEASAVWAISRENIWWVPIDAAGLADKIGALRAAIDPTGATRGVAEAGSGSADAAPPGFDTTLASAVYRQVFGDLGEAIADKRHLLVVPSASLSALPFEALALSPAPDGKDIRSADWLVRHVSIAVLPSVSALQSLRNLPPRGGPGEAFAGFGNPDTSALKIPLAPLPGTAAELAALAKSLHAAPGAIRQAEAATPDSVRSADLSQARVIAFATHGLQAGEAEGLKEPALVLTPDSSGNPFLTASDVTGLKLDADFVILSACNTAGGDAAGNEGFSGLARAFFYAGARSLLVSHWPVYSDAAVKLTTGTLAELTAHPEIGRDEALRRSMIDILDHDPDPQHWLPAYWAPFALIGATGR